MVICKEYTCTSNIYPCQCTHLSARRSCCSDKKLHPLDSVAPCIQESECMRRLDTALSSCMLVTSPGRTVISTSPSKAHKEGIDIWHLFPELVTYLQLALDIWECPLNEASLSVMAALHCVSQFELPMNVGRLHTFQHWRVKRNLSIYRPHPLHFVWSSSSMSLYSVLYVLISSL